MELQLSLSTALFIFGGAQAIIFLVIRRFVQQAVTGEPPTFLRLVVGLTGLVAVALIGAGVYFAVAGG